jgi:hypothetical protein
MYLHASDVIQFAVLCSPIAYMPSVGRGAEVDGGVTSAKSDGGMDSNKTCRLQDGAWIVTERKK